MSPIDVRLLCKSVLDQQMAGTTASFNETVTAMKEEDVEKTEVDALLYIVVTLLFYSLGIIVGIITYLKREREEIEEDKRFDAYLSMKTDLFAGHKSFKVQQVTARLHAIENEKKMRENTGKQRERYFPSDSRASSPGTGSSENAAGDLENNEVPSFAFPADTDEGHKKSIADKQPLCVFASETADPEKQTRLLETSARLLPSLEYVNEELSGVQNEAGPSAELIRSPEVDLKTPLLPPKGCLVTSV